MEDSSRTIQDDQNGRDAIAGDGLQQSPETISSNLQSFDNSSRKKSVAQSDIMSMDRTDNTSRSDIDKNVNSDSETHAGSFKEGNSLDDTAQGSADNRLFSDITVATSIDADGSGGNISSARVTDESEEEGKSDDGDPIPSGTGTVSRECSASDLAGWSKILPRWHSNLNSRPKGLTILVRSGIPEPLRGEIWQLLSGAQQNPDLMEKYRIYLTKQASAEPIILRDVHRTYPAHDNFRSDADSRSLLDSLFKVCKAYSVYDEEVGYCQGLSFLVAALLLHMPEEQAFCVFVCIMQHYGLRDLFRNNFDELYLKFYQLERLLEEQVPQLYQHFVKIGIEPFTYASQWFLTVFTAKFPLNAVFYIMDIFLLDGMDTIFQIALALLSASQHDLLALDFEGVLKYFRVQMPKRYRNQENVQQLITTSSSISLKRLKKHAKAYEMMKQKERLQENPLTRLQRENAKLTENNIRLEQENDDLARDLVASKIQLRAQIDALEDKTETLNRALTYSRQDCQNYMNTISDMEDERSRLEVEATQLKEVCRRELKRSESEQARDSSIISEYKKICSRLSKRSDYRSHITREFVNSVKDILKDNDSCSNRTCLELFSGQADEFLETLESNTLEQTSSPQAMSQDSSPKSTCSQQMIRAASVETDHANRPIGALLKSDVDQSTSSVQKIEHLTKHVNELEVELARTKLALVEAECKCQQLTHDMSLGVTVTTSNSGNRIQTSSLSDKLVSMKAAIASSRRSPKSPTSGGGAFAKMNGIISEKLSGISQSYPTPPGTLGQTFSSMPHSKSKQFLAGTTINFADSENNNGMKSTKT